MPDGSIKAEGRKVRCASCKNVWQAHAELPFIHKQEDSQIIDVLSKIPVSETGDIDAGTGRINLKVERTVDDDLMASGDDLPENSQDDIDALFDTPTAEEFGGEAIEPLIAPDVKSATRITAFKNWLSEKTHKRRELKASRSAKILKPVEIGKKTGNYKKKNRKIPVAASLAALIFVILGAGIIYRESVVQALPQSANLYKMVGLPVNLRGVVIQNVSSKIALEQGNPELTVEGEITNVTRQSVKLSRLRFAIRSENGREIYSWKATADKPVLEPGESVKFRRKLSGPPEEGHDVLVRFETRGDMVAGVQ